MANTLPRGVYRGINRAMTKDFNRFAKRTYGMSGKRLLAKVASAEGGGTAKRPNVSYAGARGPFQFIPSTRDAYIDQYGVDAWKTNTSAAKAAMIHLKGTGVAGYNPGMGSYEGLVLGQKVNTKPLRTGRVEDGPDLAPGKRRARTRVRGGRPAKVKTTVTRTPAIDNSGLRRDLKLSYLADSDDPGALLELAGGLKAAKDVPGSVKRTVKRQPGIAPTRKEVPGRAGNSPVLANTGKRTARSMLRLALKADKLNRAGKLDYQWGGGHGLTPAQIGELVDCSGFVSQILGVSPRVSGQFTSWGKPGRGKFATVYANSGHVFMSIRDPRTKRMRWFGTSRSNPGGGAGEISEPDVSGFTARHPGRR